MGEDWRWWWLHGGYMVVTCERILYLVNQFEKKKKKKNVQEFYLQPQTEYLYI